LKLTGQLRLQHDELSVLAQELERELDTARLGRNESLCRDRLGKLLARLSVHLALEDKILFPKLLVHERKDVVRLARRFIDEMGSLGRQVKEFASRWEAPCSIQERPAVFVAECRAILAALLQRVRREDEELYALAHELGL
jgi:hypothetical protein